MKNLVTCFAVYVLLVSIEKSNHGADTWKKYEFKEGISLSSPVKITRQESDSGIVYIGTDLSPLPNPRFSVYALAVVPLTKDQKQQKPVIAMRKAIENSWTHDLNRDLRILSSEPTAWKNRDSLLTLAKSRFAPLPYTQYHIDRSFIHDGIRYSLSASQLMQNTNSLAMSEFGLVPSKAELRQEELRIRRAAERFFKSFTCKNIEVELKSATLIASEQNDDGGP